MSVDVCLQKVDKKKIYEKIKDIKNMNIFNYGDDYFSFVFRGSGFDSCKLAINRELPEIKIPLAKTENCKKTNIYFKIDTRSDIKINPTTLWKREKKSFFKIANITFHLPSLYERIPQNRP